MLVGIPVVKSILFWMEGGQMNEKETVIAAFLDDEGYISVANATSGESERVHFAPEEILLFENAAAEGKSWDRVLSDAEVMENLPRIIYQGPVRKRFYVNAPESSKGVVPMPKSHIPKTYRPKL